MATRAASTHSVDHAAIVERLRDELERRGISIYRVASDAGIGYRHAHRLLSRTRPVPRQVYLDTVVRVARAMGIDICDLIALATRGDGGG